MSAVTRGCDPRDCTDACYVLGCWYERGQVPPPVLGAGDRIESKPCVVTILSRQGGLAYGRCGPCGEAHIIDAERFDNGQGPWRTAAVTDLSSPSHEGAPTVGGSEGEGHA